MEINNPSRHGDSPAQPVDRMAFDMLRAIVGARQSATPTVRIVLDRDGSADGAPLSAIDLLNGRMAPETPSPGPSAFHASEARADDWLGAVNRPVLQRSGEKQ